MEINHCYPDSTDSSLSSSNQHKHLGSPSAAFCKTSWGVLMEREEARRPRSVLMVGWVGGGGSYNPATSVQVLYINLPEQ